MLLAPDPVAVIAGQVTSVIDHTGLDEGVARWLPHRRAFVNGGVI